MFEMKSENFEDVVADRDGRARLLFAVAQNFFGEKTDIDHADHAVGGYGEVQPGALVAEKLRLPDVKLDVSALDERDGQRIEASFVNGVLIDFAIKPL